jgi:hypothetical protein
MGAVRRVARKPRTHPDRSHVAVRSAGQRLTDLVSTSVRYSPHSACRFEDFTRDCPRAAEAGTDQKRKKRRAAIRLLHSKLRISRAPTLAEWPESHGATRM